MLNNGSDLKYFQELSKTKNISRAAERLGISQPSLSLSVKRIEASVGTPIIYRNKKGVTLTPAGKEVLKKSSQLLGLWEEVIKSAKSSVNEVEGNISLGLHPSVGLYTLQYFIPQLLKKFPKLEFKFIHDLSRKINEQVISMEIDIGIVVNPVRHPDLVIHHLCQDEVTFFTGKKKTIMNDPYNGNAVLICDTDLSQSQSLLKKIQNKGIKYSRVITTSNLENITSMTIQGAGIGILPTRVSKIFGENKTVKIHNAPKFMDEICLLYRMENKDLQSIKQISKLIREKIR